MDAIGLEELRTEWRIWVLAAALLLSLVLMGPTWSDGGTGFETNINTGIQISGGLKAVLSANTTGNVSEGNITTTMSTLEQRISAFGLTQSSTRQVVIGGEPMIQLTASDLDRERLNQLTSQNGSFSARMPFWVSGERTFELQGSTHTLNFNGETVSVDNVSYSPGEQFNIGEVQFHYLNNTESRANLEATMYTDDDIVQVIESDTSVANQRFSIPILITTEQAGVFQQITRNYDTGVIAGDSVLTHQDGSPAPMNLYVEGTRVGSLSTVASGFRTGEAPTRSFIRGGAETNAAARQEMDSLIGILQSGELPFPLTIEEFSQTSPQYGSLFMSTAVLSIVIALVAVGGLVYLRYGSAKYVLPIVLTGSSEVLILLGTFFSTVVTLDLTSIAGIIAAVGTGVDDQIIITDESDREQMLDWAERLKKAFFVIFTSAASTIGAMVPIVSPSFAYQMVGVAGAGLIGYTLYRNRRANPHFIAIGAIALMVSVFSSANIGGSYALQQIQGFAITTILGVMIGITITRPAYAKIIEVLD